MPLAGTLLIAGAAAQAPEGQHDAAAAAARAARFALWQRGDHMPCDADDAICSLAKWSYLRQSPVMHLRGGADGCSAATGTCDPPDAPNLDALRAELGPEFSAALDRNEADHADDCAKSCEHFFCGAREEFGPVVAPPVEAVHMGSVPPEDFSTDFRFPLDLIKVTKEPIIPHEEAEEVVATANTEGLANNEYTSGKYLTSYMLHLTSYILHLGQV